MKQSWIIVIGALVILFSCAFAGMYNGLVGASNNVENMWADLQSAYQRRLDLVNQTMPVVTAGAAQELAVFKTLRDQAAALAGSFKYDESGRPVVPTGADAEKITQQIQAFDKAFIDVMVYIADNPEIQSAQLFSDFMVQIEGSENRINVARRDYNGAVTKYRNLTQQLPTSIVAWLFGFDPDAYPFFQASEAAQNAPQISFPTPAVP